jgi:uncharacterized repeat protein (TIGR01451 family)/gliding motility-associated-like protein
MIRIGLFYALLLCSSHMVHSQQPFTCEDQFFLTLSTMPPSLNEVIIDPQTNAAVFQSINPNLSIEVNATGYRSTDNFIYSINTTDGRLVRIGQGGQMQALTTLNLNLDLSYFAGDVTPDGRFLVLVGTAFLQSGLTTVANIVRVDLTSPTFTLTTVPVSNVFGQIYDIAFHPVTGDLYGYDSASRRLVRLDPFAGTVTFPFEPNQAPFISGSLFFDAYGELFAYGSPEFDSDQNSLYAIDVSTGRATFLTSGATAPSSDGCSCPYTIELSKSVEPSTTFPCGEVEYTFEIVNTSNRPHIGIRLEDRLPPGFTFVSVSSNPLSGDVLSQPGDNRFILDNINLPDGRFEIKIIVNVGTVAPGIYRNQARLINIPPALGGTRISDDRKTLVLDDSTSVRVINFDFDEEEATRTLCGNVPSITLDARSFLPNLPGQVTYFWSDGSRDPQLDVTQVGTYTVDMVLGCDTATVVFTVDSSSLDVEMLTLSPVTIALGDETTIEATVTSSDPYTSIWNDPQEVGSVTCTSCLETLVRPFNDIRYTITATNTAGCRDTASVRILVLKSREVYAPNAFSPIAENSGNSTFYLSGDPFTEVDILQVFSRWGDLLYEIRDVPVNDQTSGWDGTARGQDLQPGVYVWWARIRYLDGLETILKGDVHLIK